MRAFLAVDLGVDVQARLIDLKRELARHGAAVRWVGDDALHVTIKFLGSVTDDALAGLREALTAPLARLAPLDATLRGLGVFPDWRRPRVVWAGVDCAGLARVAAAVEDAAAAHDIARDARPFAAHVTLGRVRDARGWAPLAAVLRTRLTEVVGNCRCDALHAYSSDLRPDGALYTKLWSIPFGA